MLRRYLLRRLLHALVLLAGVSALSFILLELAPGDFLGEAKLNPQLGSQTLTELREQYGLNKSLPQKYMYWLGSVAKGDFGVSFAYNLPVSTLMWPRARKTLELTMTSLVLSWLIAVPLGVFSAAGLGGWVDRIAGVVVSVLLSIPDLILACIVLLGAVRFGAFHSGDPVLAITVLVLGALPMVLRHTRSTLRSAAEQPFARAARANGISGWQLWFRWLLPAAANPLISLFGLSVGALLSASLLVETILGWPGLGPLLLEAIGARDFYLVTGPVLLSALFLAFGTLLGDLLLFMVDPRIRMEK